MNQIRVALVIIAPLFLTGCPSALAALGASALTRFDGYQSLRANQREVWLARQKQIDDEAIFLLMNRARALAAENDFDGMVRAIEAARRVHREGRPDLPLIPFTGSEPPPTYPQQKAP